MMLPASVDWKKVRKELTEKRTELFERFVKNPAEIRLAREIKLLDDQLLECSEHIERQRKRRA